MNDEHIQGMRALLAIATASNAATPFALVAELKQAVYEAERNAHGAPAMGSDTGSMDNEAKLRSAAQTAIIKLSEALRLTK